MGNLSKISLSFPSIIGEFMAKTVSITQVRLIDELLALGEQMREENPLEDKTCPTSA